MKDIDGLFNGYHFDREVIALCGDWLRPLCQHGRNAYDHDLTDRQADGEPEQEFLNIIDGLHAIVYEGFADPMQGKKRMLSFCFRCDEPHGGSHCRFADCLDVYEMVPVTFNEEAHELQRDEFDLMCRHRQFAGHVMRAGTGFRHRGTHMKRNKEFNELLARYFPAKHHLPGRSCPCECNECLPRSIPTSFASCIMAFLRTGSHQSNLLDGWG